MAAFDSASRAVGAATRIQRALEEGGRTDKRLRVRIGVAAGEPVTEHDDLFGAAVQQAARLCECAEPECIVVSSGVYDLCRGKAITFSNRRSLDMKGFDEPIEAYEVHWRSEQRCRECSDWGEPDSTPPRQFALRSKLHLLPQARGIRLIGPYRGGPRRYEKRS